MADGANRVLTWYPFCGSLQIVLTMPRNWEVFERPMAYTSEYFDRRTFNPDSNPTHKSTLTTLRAVGRSRGWHCVNSVRYPRWPIGKQHDSEHFWCCGSSALKALWKTFQQPHTNDVFIDIGCGNSPDAYIAGINGFNSFALDLFPPTRGSAMAGVFDRNGRFSRADALNLPYASACADVIVCQAMIDLIVPAERLAFYREVARVLKVGGVFSLYGQSLSCGYGWRTGNELQRVRGIPNLEIESNASGFLATRVADGVKPQTPYSRGLFRRYVFYPTAEECAKAAAPLFQLNGWRYGRNEYPRSYIPDEAYLLKVLLYLSTHKDGCETGRLCYYDGQFGHQKPR